MIRVLLKSSELRPGDVVITHGMRCLIDLDIKSGPDAYTGRVFFTSARVTNLEDVKREGFVPLGWLSPDGDARRWTLQGNDNASWPVERELDALPERIKVIRERAAACSNPWHGSAPARMNQACPECPATLEAPAPQCIPGHHVWSDCTTGSCEVKHAERFGYGWVRATDLRPTR